MLETQQLIKNYQVCAVREPAFCLGKMNVSVVFCLMKHWLKFLVRMSSIVLRPVLVVFMHKAYNAAQTCRL